VCILATLEEALADGSKAVRTYAMSQALASDDDVMKELAIAHFFTIKNNLSIKVTQNEELKSRYESLESESEIKSLKSKESRSFWTFGAYAPSIIYSIKSFDSASGEFKGFCMKKQTKANENYQLTGVLTGDKLSFEHRCDVGSQIDQCSINMTLSEEEIFIGSIRCGSENYPSVVTLPLR